MIKRDKDWRAYPIGTKAHAYNGGAWLRTDRGWQWNGGVTFPTPGADAIGYCIELPENASVKIPANPAESQPPAGGFFTPADFYLSGKSVPTLITQRF